MSARPILAAVAVSSLLSASAFGQNAATVISNASRAMGADNLNSITYYGSAANYNLGQNNNANGPWPRVNVNDYRRTIDFTQPALRSTGGAVGLCSMTTIIGYSSLLLAQNRGLYLFGVVAVLGEVTCLVTALTLLPAGLLLLGRRRRQQRQQAPESKPAQAAQEAERERTPEARADVVADDAPAAGEPPLG